MTVKVAINGFGRIGRLAFRQMFESPEFDIVAINDLTSAKTLAHLLKYDSAQGNWNADKITSTDSSIIVDGKEIKITAIKDPAELSWKELGVDIVFECTGLFVDKEKAEAHVKAGARKVIISAPAKGDLKTIVFNVNHDILDGNETVISAASCTTNCLAPVAKVLNDKFGLVKGYMTTVHAYTNDQALLDQPHRKGDLRRSRAAANSITPSTTGAAAAVGKVLPELKGKLDGVALRVPTITGSIVDLVVELGKEVTVEDVNAAMKAASNETLGYTEDEIVSVDVIGTRFGSIFDATQTMVMSVDGKQMVKVFAWYDNEMSYVSQMVRTAKFFANKI